MIYCVRRALSYHLFTAASLLLRECKDKNDPKRKDMRDAITAALDLLDQVSAHSALANCASVILREQIIAADLM